MIDDRYLLVMIIPTYVDGEERRYADELWHKDLVKHAVVIHDLVLAAPRHEVRPDGPAVFLIDQNTFEGTISYVDLPPSRTRFSAIRSLPQSMRTLWKAIGEAEIVHVGVAGWPLPFGWIAAPMARLRGKFLMSNVESASWREGWKRPRRPKAFVEAVLYEVMARFCVNISDLVTSTQAGYIREMVVPWRRHRGHVFSASWIDDDVILPLEQAEAVWDEKLRDPARPLRVCFAGSLMTSKGVPVLLDALERLDRRGLVLDAHIYGKGPLLDDCAAHASRLHGPVSLTLGGILPYGPPFFEMIRGHDMMLAPSTTDEQPRVVYDSFSQAVPVIASDTTGLRECVTDAVNGKFIPSGDPQALADAIAWASDHRGTLRDLGIGALNAARELTHDMMHARRAAVIKEALRIRRNGRAGPVSDTMSTTGSITPGRHSEPRNSSSPSV
jgi:glycosyltransferase involved in cell wall biosynthesis